MKIAIVGAGGKTTISRKIAYELSRMTCYALLTTTTKIFCPEDGSVYIGPVQSIPTDSFFMTAACETLSNGKLKGYTPDELEQIPSIFDHIIVEADGANRKPVKAPSDTEPVYPLHTDIIIGVIGLDCLGKPITDEFVHRKELFLNVTEAKSGDIITAQHLLRLIRHPNGLFRGAPSKARKIVFLNKYDTIDNKNKEEVTAIVKMASLPVMITGYDADWFTEFYAGYMEGCL
jgi:probable selenium-dependent hydroxylase accessory protein YqeC